ncbi:helix-turn-helix domain-containing protein [Plantactinospora sp. KBS50]|uniref:helix-turn-helix transcriptional regulator n=1 Tax=Plantactinospora sp. KBS50 TaxID=2024580 RepID=UPI001E2A24B5|nr:helix-turn-helix domain-containing protein [Plantactinospora sp. KBS50]
MYSESETAAIMHHYLVRQAGRSPHIRYIAGFTAAGHEVSAGALEQSLLQESASMQALIDADMTARLSGTDEYFEQMLGHHVRARTVNRRLPRFAVLDGAMLLLRTDHASVPRFLIVRESHLVRSMATIFDAMFERAVDLSVAARFTGQPGEADDTENRLIRVLTMLDAGYTDETAARKLGVSVRTYRRYVAETMAQLDVSSRFQAGVRAATLNLIPAPRSVRYH